MAKQKYNYDQTLFTIDTEEKAYILGFIVADGTLSLTKTNHCIKIYQKEYEILNDISKITGGVVKKQSTRDLYHLTINSKFLFEAAQKVGLRVNKTYNGIDTELMKQSIPNNLIVHFFRGLIDGDGCITLTPAQSYEFQPCIHISIPDLKILDWMKTYFNLPYKISERNRKDCLPMYSLTIRSTYAIQLCKEMYLNSHISLQRKQKRAIMIMNFFDS